MKLRGDGARTPSPAVTPGPLCPAQNSSEGASKASRAPSIWPTGSCSLKKINKFIRKFNCHHDDLTLWRGYYSWRNDLPNRTSKPCPLSSISTSWPCEWSGGRPYLVALRGGRVTS